jgi:alpha-tubulin suppressor-like RCC1 family protein
LFSYGQIGDGSTIDRPSPVAVSTSDVLSNILQITAGGGHTCAIANDSNPYCWGYNK